MYELANLCYSAARGGTPAHAPASVRSDVLRRTPAEFWNTRICALRRTQTYSDVLRRTQTYSIYSCRVLEHPHLCAQTGASRAFRACVGQADAQGASCQAATRPLSLESLWSEQKELKVKGLESLWSEKKELKELKVKCGWPAAGLRQSNICGWPAAGLRQSNMLEKLHKTQSPRRFQHTLYCTRTHTHTAPHTHPASPKQAAAYTHRIQIQYGRQGNTDRQGRGDIGVYWY